MPEVSVSLHGTRVNDSDANTDWEKIVITGPTPAAEPQLVYQGTNVVNVQNKRTADQGGLAYNPAANPVDMVSAAGTEGPLFFFKGYISDYADLVSASSCYVRVGSDGSNYYDWIVAGTSAAKTVFGTYPAQGGYMLYGINPSVADWREGTTGTPVLSAVDYWGYTARFVNGASKSENMAFDAIDVGRGLILVGGSAEAASPGTFDDFVSADQTNIDNRWGVISEKGGVITCVGQLAIGDSSTETGFIDDGQAVVVFPDGYVGPGDLGIKVNIVTTSSVAEFSTSQLLGRGTEDPVDTRPDFVVSGVTGSVRIEGTTFNNFRNITLTSACDVSAASISCKLLTQNSALITDGTIIETLATSNEATLQDPAFDTSNWLNNSTFVQAGTGHAIEVLATATFTGIGFQGYGGTPGTNSAVSTGSADSAILNDTGSHIFITIAGGGDVPSVRNGAGAITTVIAAVNVTFTGMRDNTEIRVYEAGTSSEVDGIENATDGSTDNRSFTWQGQNGQSVDYVIHSVTYETIRVEGFTVPATDTSVAIQQRFDRNYSNP